MIRRISENNGLSKQTVRNYLILYLVYQNISVLAPKEKEKNEDLTEDQKNIRWALNKFFYTQTKNSLPVAYSMMLKERYADEYGILKDHPSLSQFRYFYRKTKKEENYLISRNGIKHYQRNCRPLLGDGVQEYAPQIGTAYRDRGRS